MIQIKPKIEHHSKCPYCEAILDPRDILWQGIHVCIVSKCSVCNSEIIEDLRVGQAIFTPYQVDLKGGRLFGSEDAINWFGQPFIRSLQNPLHNFKINLEVEKFFQCQKVVVLNCIDYLYGHSLLKLLNAEEYLHERSNPGLIIIVPKFLRWMVPDGAAEVWTVDLPLGKAQNYYPELDKLIKQECQRFKVIYVGLAHSHPKNFDITRFTGINRHDFNDDKFRITFIWREDRPWWGGDFSFRVLRKLGLTGVTLFWQKRKVSRLFGLLRQRFPRACFTVAGLGKTLAFPDWIDDRRVERFTEESEREVCRIYSESRLVIGVHGSNMLLPSAHAGMSLDLMPLDRWSNFAQDILYQEEDNRLASFRYRFLPIDADIDLLFLISAHQIEGYSYFKKQMLPNKVAGY